MENETNTIVETVEETETTEEATIIETTEIEEIIETVIESETETETEATAEVETEETTETELASSTEELHEEHDTIGEAESITSDSDNEFSISYDVSSLETLILEQNELLSVQTERIDYQTDILTFLILSIWAIYMTRGSVHKLRKRGKDEK